MKEETRRVEVLKISGKTRAKEHDLVVKESPVTVFLNDVELVTLLCTPRDVEYLAVGFLYSEGIVKSKKDIKRLYGDRKERAVWVETAGKTKLEDTVPGKRFITTGCGKGLSFIDSSEFKGKLKKRSGRKIPSSLVGSLMKEFQKRSEVYRATGGVHSAGLANARGIVAFNEDIGRHNAIDKVLGESVLKGVKTNDLILMTSGRVSSDILVKAARARIPVIVSRSAPTDLSVKLARDLGITLVGFARGSRMNVYSHTWRIQSASSESR